MHLLSGARDGSIKVWDNQGACLRTLRGHRGQVAILAMPPSAQLLPLTTAGRQQSGHPGNAPSNAHVNTPPTASVAPRSSPSPPPPPLPSHLSSPSPTALHQSPHAQLVAAGDGSAPDAASTPSAVDRSEQAVLQPLPGLVTAQPLVDAFPSHLFGQGSFSSSRVMSCGSDGVVRLWDFVSGRCMRRFEGHRGAVTCLKWGWPGYAASGGADGAVHVWNVLSGQCVASLDTTQTLMGVDCSGSDLGDASMADHSDDCEADSSVASAIVLVEAPAVRSPLRRNVSPGPGGVSMLPSPGPERGPVSAGAGLSGVTQLEWSGDWVVCVNKLGVVRVCKWEVEFDSLGATAPV